MLRFASGPLILSVGDLVQAAHCRYGLLREIDARFQSVERATGAHIDSAWSKVLRLGRLHEANVLAEYQRRFGTAAVVKIPRPGECTESALREAAEQTSDAMRSGARVVYQATIFDGRLLGYADFLVREENGEWRVEDAKLTAAAAYEARLQVAAYASVLGAAGVHLLPAASIALGDGTVLDVPLDDVVPAFVQLREGVEALVDAHLSSGHAARWAPDEVLACGRCGHCREAAEAARDLMLVHGVGHEERAALHRAGIRTSADLAAAEDGVAVDLPPTLLGRLRKQAALQLRTEDTPDTPTFEVAHADLLGRLPAPDEGDLFLSFAAQGRRDQDGEPDHLFTVLATTGTAQTYWGDDRQAEAAEFARFLVDVQERRRRFPGLRIYHYSPIDRPHLVDLAEPSGAGAEQIESLIEQGVLVDLYGIAVGALVIGTPDHSLRQVGRLADPELARALATTDVRAERAEHRRLLAQGDPAAAAALRGRLERENRERCILTHRLRDRLLALMADHGVQPGSVLEPRRTARTRSRVARAIDAELRDGADAVHAFAAAALNYHAREASVFWRGHARRLHRQTDEWATRTRGAARVDLIRVEEDWTEGKQGGVTRLLRLRVTVAPGTTIKLGEQPFLVYDGAPVFHDPRAALGSRTATGAEVLERMEDELLVRERLPKGAARWRTTPAALAPARPPRTSALQHAVERWAETLLQGGTEASAASDLVRRRAPRIAGAGPVRILDVAGRLDARASLVRSIEALDRSFLAVQGPPGSGKTTLGAQAIADLLERGYRIGVVAQSHAVVEHFLGRVVAAGAPADRVAKHVRGGGHDFTVIGRDAVRSFMRAHDDGFVIGGTAWDFTNRRRVPPGSLDLLVIDEAGQFGLVNAIAVAQAAKNLLLLGDPQQLSQVSQAAHRAAADSSALGWLLDGGAVLPERYGYFLDRTWRMHPALTRAVSDLSYDGELGAHEPAGRRVLQGVTPGLHLRPVRHIGNTDASAEEAAEVGRIVREVLGRPWVGGSGDRSRPLTQRDVIVVAPYNAQVQRIRRALRAAGLPDVEVGTVDRFQGREAIVAVYSTTVSSLALRPQATDFVLGRNRLNVAISRAQWAAYLVHAQRLADFPARNATDAAAQSRFLRLMEFAIQEDARVTSGPQRPAA